MDPTAILGCYRSGSSLVAAILHAVGVDMGQPFWGDYYEPIDLSDRLRRWWNEPELQECVNSAERVAYLSGWLKGRKEASKGRVGAKHPLLSLCGKDLEAAWGTGIKWIWAKRPLEESIVSLERLGWWPNAKHVQQTIWMEAESFLNSRRHLVVDFASMLVNPRDQILMILDFLDIVATEEQIEIAENCVEPGLRTVNLSREDTSATRGAARPIGSPKIVATIITGNSESIVVEAVQSVRKYVDQFLVVDTGIADATLDNIKRSAQIPVHTVKFEWTNNFAEVRNFTLDVAASYQASWALTLDTDERMDLSYYRSKQQLSSQLESDNVLAWMVNVQDGSYAKERFIKVPCKSRWVGRTHESLSTSKDFSRKVLPAASFWELPKTKEDFRAKLTRDLAVLQEDLGKSPGNARLWFYLGQTLEGQRQYNDAFEAYNKCLQLSEWPEEAAWSAFKAASCLCELRQFKKAEVVCAIGMTKQADFPELPWLAGWCAYRRSVYIQALHWSKMACSIGSMAGNDPAVSRIGFRFLVAWYEGPFDVLRYSLKTLGDSKGADIAEEQYQRAKATRLKAYQLSTGNSGAMQLGHVLPDPSHFCTA